MSSASVHLIFMIKYLIYNFYLEEGGPMKGIINGIFNYACGDYFSVTQVLSQRLIVYKMTKERRLIHLRLVPFSTHRLD